MMHRKWKGYIATEKRLDFDGAPEPTTENYFYGVEYI